MRGALRTVAAVAGRLLRAVAALTLLLGLIAGLPWLLVTFIGWPLPQHVPAWDEVATFLGSPLSDQVILDVLACACWIAWAAFTIETFAATVTAVTHLRRAQAPTVVGPRGGHRLTGLERLEQQVGHQRPLGRVAAGLVGAVLLAVIPVRHGAELDLATATAAAATDTLPPHDGPGDGPPFAGVRHDPPRPPASAVSSEVPISAAVNGAGDRTRRQVVVRPPHDRTHDSLWRIAERELGDPRRWPEIYRLNVGAPQPDGRHVQDPDLIHPGWILELPAGPAPQRETTRPANPANPAGPEQTKPTPPAPDASGGGGHPTTPQTSPTADPTAEPSPTAKASAPPSTPDTQQQPQHDKPAPDAEQAPASPGPARSRDTPPTAESTTAPATPTPTPTPGAAASAAPSSTPSDRPTSESPAARPDTHRSADAAARDDDRPTDRPTAGDADRDANGDVDGDVDLGGDGINLPGGFLPWTLASAVTSMIALLWLQRRRRHRPGDDGDDPMDLPALLLDVHRQTNRNPAVPRSPDLAERAAAVPAYDPLPPGGLGLVGDGAHAAARAMLVAALTSGGPRDPDGQGEVVIDGATLTTLIGADAAALAPWPRLHVADDLDTALTMLDARLLQRSRILDEHALTDLDSLRAQAPDEEPLPPVLLIAEAPPPGAQSRARTTLTLGADFQITAALLGEWPHGSTLHVDPDGHSHIVGTNIVVGQDVEQAPAGQDAAGQEPGEHDGAPGESRRRVGVLDTGAAVAILTAIREAHTGERPIGPIPPRRSPRPADEQTAPPDSGAGASGITPAGLASPDSAPSSLTPFGGASGDVASPELVPADLAGSGGVPGDQAVAGATGNAVDSHAVDHDRTGRPTSVTTSDSGTDDSSDGGTQDSTGGDSDGGTAVPVKAQLRILGGPPGVPNATSPGKPLRAKAAELAAFLACHPEGADTRTIGEHLVPDVRLRSADVQVHTNVSNLRHVLGRAAGPGKGAHVIKTDGRYRLDPRTVQVDLWRMRELVTNSVAAPHADRIKALQQACDLYAGPLADGCDYDWIEPHREKARQQATEAHLMLADALAPHDPQTACDVLDRAIRLDRYNEELYRHGMHARHRIGDRDAIRGLLRALTSALADLDTEPDDDIVQLAHRLATSAR
jgi:DNA-binding SARP family transcriptional activator